MKRLMVALFAAAVMAGGGWRVAAQGQDPDQGQDEIVGQDRHLHLIVRPHSSIKHAEDKGERASTNHLLVIDPLETSVSVDPLVTGPAPSGETPASIRAVYGLPAIGGSYTIAVVTAFHYPTALNDFNTFSTQFGLPVETSTKPTASANKRFQVVYASGKQPVANCGWAQEAALDIQWAHAMAPSAKIILVEAVDNTYVNLFAAVNKANGLSGVKEVAMSWGGAEWSTETSYDTYLAKSGIVYFAAAGDVGGVTVYPGVSSSVVSVGGTTINRDASLNFLSETAWSGGGGGLGLYVARPSYQDVVSTLVGTKRGAPDFSFDADPSSGVSVYDSTVCNSLSGWLVFGGTSVGAPALAGIVNLAGHFYTSSAAELTTIYSNVDPSTGLINSTNFWDVVTGFAGSFSAQVGWDSITGVGSGRGLNGK